MVIELGHTGFYVARVDGLNVTLSCDLRMAAEFADERLAGEVARDLALKLRGYFRVVPIEEDQRCVVH